MRASLGTRLASAQLSHKSARVAARLFDCAASAQKMGHSVIIAVLCLSCVYGQLSGDNVNFRPGNSSAGVL